jgi:nicotinamidase-related amidase
MDEGTSELDDHLLLIIDLQAVVAPGGAWELPGIEPIIGAAARVAEHHRGPALATRHRPVPDQPGTHGPFAQHDDLDPLTHDASDLAPPIGHLEAVDKQSYSALESEEIRTAAERAGGVILCGIETDCCVLATVFDLLDAQIPTIVVSDAVLGPDEVGHEGTLRCLQRLGEFVQLRTVDELVGANPDT